MQNSIRVSLGVRIEDVVLVTPAGMECLSCGAPSELLADVEKAIAAGRAQKASTPIPGGRP
jgi:Xaa-Pro aminopeptidase